MLLKFTFANDDTESDKAALMKAFQKLEERARFLEFLSNKAPDQPDQPYVNETLQSLHFTFSTDMGIPFSYRFIKF